MTGQWISKHRTINTVHLTLVILCFHSTEYCIQNTPKRSRIAINILAYFKILRVLTRDNNNSKIQ